MTASQPARDGPLPVNRPGAMAQQWFETFLDQWKSGHNAELWMNCESGRLKVNMCADLGSWTAQSGGNGIAVSPCRLRRRERRAAMREHQFVADKVAEVHAVEEAAEKAAFEKEAAEKAVFEREAAEKAAFEKEAAEKAAFEEADAKKAVLEKEAAEKAAFEKEAAEKAAGEKATTAAAAEKVASEMAEKVKSTVEIVTTVAVKEGNSDDSGIVPSTSCLGGKSQAGVVTPWKVCWDCDNDMNVDHQCETGKSLKVHQGFLVAGLPLGEEYSPKSLCTS